MNPQQHHRAPGSKHCPHFSARIGRLSRISGFGRTGPNFAALGGTVTSLRRTTTNLIGLSPALERNGKCAMENPASEQGLVNARRPWKPDLDDRRHSGWPRFLRPVCRCPNTGKLRFLTCPCFTTRIPNHSGNGASMNCYATPSPVIEPGRVLCSFRQLRHSLPRYQQRAKFSGNALTCRAAIIAGLRHPRSRVKT